MFTSRQAARIIGQFQDNVVVVHTMTMSHEWRRFAKDSKLDIGLGGAMGKTASVALGIALAKPDRRVYVLDGDGSLLMNLGTLVTIGSAGPTNLVHFVFENGVYEVTGGQAIPGAGLVDFAGMAKGAGYRAAYTFDNAKDFEEAAGRILAEDGPTLINLKLKTSEDWEACPERDFIEALENLKENLAG